jgi:hypothetical protein
VCGSLIKDRKGGSGHQHVGGPAHVHQRMEMWTPLADLAMVETTRHPDRPCLLDEWELFFILLFSVESL